MKRSFLDDIKDEFGWITGHWAIPVIQKFEQKHKIFSWELDYRHDVLRLTTEFRDEARILEILLQEANDGGHIVFADPTRETNVVTIQSHPRLY
jgi:hypothetical protein